MNINVKIGLLYYNISCLCLQKVVYMDSKLYSCSMTNPALPSDPPKSFTFDGVRYRALIGQKTQY